MAQKGSQVHKLTALWIRAKHDSVCAGCQQAIMGPDSWDIRPGNRVLWIPGRDPWPHRIRTTPPISRVYSSVYCPGCVKSERLAEKYTIKEAPNVPKN